MKLSQMFRATALPRAFSPRFKGITVEFIVYCDGGAESRHHSSRQFMLHANPCTERAKLEKQRIRCQVSNCMPAFC